MIGLVSLARRRRGGSGGAAAVAVDQTIDVGAQSLSGAEVARLVSSTGGTLSGVSVTGGTASNVSISSTGVVTPDSNAALNGQDGDTITISSDQGTATVTLKVRANTISIGTDANITTFMGQSTANLNGIALQAANHYTGQGAYMGNTGGVVFGGLDSANTDIWNQDFTAFGDVFIRSDAVESNLMAHYLRPRFNVRVQSGRFAIADTAWRTGSTTFSAGRHRWLMEYDHTAGTVDFWVQPDGGSVSHELNGISESFTVANSQTVGLGGFINGSFAVSSASYAVYMRNGLWSKKLASGERTALLAGTSTPDDYTTDLVWNPSLGDTRLYNKADETEQMYGPSQGVETTILDGTDSNGINPNNMRILTDQYGNPVKYDSKYWAAIDTGGQTAIELVSSSDLASWSFESTIFTTTGLSVTQCAPTCFMYMGDLSGAHDPFFLFITVNDSGDQIWRYETDDMSTFTADAANPVYSRARSGSSGAEDWTICPNNSGGWYAVFEDDGIETNGSVAVSSATNSNTVPTGAWTHATDGLFAADPAIGGASEFSANPVVCNFGGVYHVFYEGAVSGSRRTMLATSDDFSTWTNWGAINPNGQLFPNSVYIDPTSEDIVVTAINSAGNVTSAFDFDPRRTRFGAGIRKPDLTITAVAVTP